MVTDGNTRAAHDIALKNPDKNTLGPTTRELRAAWLARASVPLHILLPAPHLVAKKVVELPPCDLPVFVEVELWHMGSSKSGRRCT